MKDGNPELAAAAEMDEDRTAVRVMIAGLVMPAIIMRLDNLPTPEDAAFRALAYADALLAKVGK